MLFTKATEIYFGKLFESQTGQILYDADGVENLSFAELWSKALLEQKKISIVVYMFELKAYLT